MALIPLAPNWSGGVRQTLDFLTEIITSDSGREQRRAMRFSPRLTTEFGAVADGPRLRTIAAKLALGPATAMQLPDTLASVAIPAGVPLSATSLVVASAPAWLAAGPAAIVRGRKVEFVTIANVAGLTVTLAAGVASAWESGSLFCPLMTGRLGAQIATTRLSDGVATVTVAFAADPGPMVSGAAGSAGTPFNGREVFAFRVNWGTAPTVSYAQPYETLDYGRGRISHFTPIEFTSYTRTAILVFETAAEVLAFKQFFIRAKGRRGEFYAPTGDNDLPPKPGTDLTSDRFFVAGSEALDAYAGSTVYRAVRVLLNDGTVVLRRVSGIVASGSDSRINLTASFAGSTPAADVASISWMPVCRFAADTLVVEWLSDGVARASVALTALEDL